MFSVWYPVTPMGHENRNNIIFCAMILHNILTDFAQNKNYGMHEMRQRFNIIKFIKIFLIFLVILWGGRSGNIKKIK